MRNWQRLMKAILISFLITLLFYLFSCEKEPICEHRQNIRLVPYLDSVHHRLSKHDIDFQRECIAVVFGKTTIAVYRGFGVIEFNENLFNNYTSTGYSRFIEVVMLHEIYHYFWLPGELDVPVKLEYSESDMKKIYNEFVQTFKEFQ